ncbi:UNVERIFIED_CONTAM: PIG-P protein [Hammondia hammondi]|eukprot:XP_008886892.1 PIG-P protein [Hammondia hammondi]
MPPSSRLPPLSSLSSSASSSLSSSPSFQSPPSFADSSSQSSPQSSAESSSLSSSLSSSVPFSASEWGASPSFPDLCAAESSHASRLNCVAGAQAEPPASMLASPHTPLRLPDGVPSASALSSCVSSPFLSPLAAPTNSENPRSWPQSPSFRLQGPRATVLTPCWSNQLTRRRLSCHSADSVRAADAASSVCGVAESPEMSAEVYGFVSWIASFAAFLFFFLWAVVPHRYFHQLSITYLVDPYWALAFPVILLICLATTFFLYTASTLLKTQPLESFNLLPGRAHLAAMPENMTAVLWSAADLSSKAIVDIATKREKCYEDPSSVLPSPPPRRIQVPEIYDLPPGVLNRIMFPLAVE